MSVTLACIMAVTTALLAAALCAVLWRRHDEQSHADKTGSSKASLRPTATMPSMDAHAPEPPDYAPPEVSLLTAQLEVNQTFYLQTQTARYALTLRDPLTGHYDAVRVGPKKGRKEVEERFAMLFTGTFIPYHGLRYGEFVPGGNLCYRKLRDGNILDMSPSTQIIRILFAIRESYRQAS